MFDGIDEQRFLRMTNQEKRWLDNVKKAFYDSDMALQKGALEERCLENLLKAVDTAQTLRRSLRGEDALCRDNRKRFIEFLGLDVPCFRPGASEIELRDRKTGEVRKYALGDIVYKIRCSMIHENENLNAAEGVDHEVLLNWSSPNSLCFGEARNQRFVLNGYLLWSCLREVLAKFITGIEGTISFANTGSCSLGTRPPLGSIRPQQRKEGGHRSTEAR